MIFFSFLNNAKSTLTLFFVTLKIFSFFLMMKLFFDFFGQNWKGIFGILPPIFCKFAEIKINFFMKKLVLFIAALTIVFSCANRGGITTKNSKSEKNHSPIIKEKIQLLENQGDKIVLKKGVYHFYPEGSFEKELYISNHDQDNPKKVAFFLENFENLTIDGSGSELVFHGTMIPFVLKNCKNVVLKNFSIDFENPHLRQLKILEADSLANVSIAEIHPKGNYVVENNRLYLTGDDYKITPEWVMAFQENKRLTYKRADVDFRVKSVTEIRPNVLKIEGWSQNAFTKKGERFALRSYHRPTPGIVIDECKNTDIQNVTVHYAYGMGLLAQMSENVYLNKFSVSLKKNDERYFTTQADATHFSGCKGIIRSENGMYEAMADDAINVHGTYLKISELVNNNTLKARYMHSQCWGFKWGEIGDEVQFVSAKTMDLLDGKIYTIKSIKAVDKPTEFGAKEFEITFNEQIPTGIDPKNGFSIENLTWTPEVIFKNNIIRNNRARGALFSTPKRVICEENLFDHTHGTAILLCGDSNGWYETGACKEVIIRNNRFINSLTANYQFTNAVISIYPEIPNLKDQKQYFHSGISIENNTFETFDAPILYAKSIQNLTFKNNKITKNNDFKPFHWNKNVFFFERVKNVTINNNIFEGGLRPNDIRLELSDKNEVSLNGNN